MPFPERVGGEKSGCDQEPARHNNGGTLMEPLPQGSKLYLRQTVHEEV